MHNALGLSKLTLKKQVEHLPKVILDIQPPHTNVDVQQNIDFGTDNEINAIVTLVFKILPVYHPNLSYFVVGVYCIKHSDQDFMIISPDGSLQDEAKSSVICACEAKH